jgi:hypothetical protein
MATNNRPESVAKANSKTSKANNAAEKPAKVNRQAINGLTAPPPTDPSSSQVLEGDGIEDTGTLNSSGFTF